MNFYTNYYLMYRQADPDQRKASRQHWIKVHKENMHEGREDLIMFSGQILTMIALAEWEHEAQQ